MRFDFIGLARSAFDRTAYKGGPNIGVFLQITTYHPRVLAIQGSKASFGAIEAARARGDFDVLTERVVVRFASTSAAILKKNCRDSRRCGATL